MLINTLLRLSLFTLFVQSAYAQPDRAFYDSLATTIQASYNGRQPEKIYALTSATFQRKMTAEQFAAGLSKFQAKAGNWNAVAFKEINEKGLDYLATFENSQQVFSLKVDEQGKISRMNFAIVPDLIAEKNHLAASNNPFKDSLDMLVEHLVRPYIQKGNTCGLVLAVIRQGRVRKYSYGSINKNVSHLPNPETTIFEIGSVTKTFTSLLLAEEVVAGRMKLDDPINLYLPDSIPALNFQEKPITLQQLSNHTSGFPRLPTNIFTAEVDPKNPYKHYNTDSLYSFLMRYHPSVMPGMQFSYSNFGAGVLGTIMERKLNSSFEQLIVGRICEPLRMGHTGITLGETARQSLAQGYNEVGEATSPWNLASLKGSGAIRSTLNDMIKYIQAQMKSKGQLKKAIELSHRTTFQSKDESMGLGWRIRSKDQKTYFHHSGGTGGFRSYVGFDPTSQTGIVILSNAAEEVMPIGEAILMR